MDKRFSKNELEYNLYLKDTDKKLSITAVPESMDAKVAVTAMLDGNDVKVNIKGNKYETVLDAVGKYIFSIKVTAEDGITNTTYIIEATKPDISDNKLSNISLSAGKLDKMFDPEKKEYNVFVENEINKIVVDAVPYNPNSVVRIYSIDSNKYLGSNKVNIALNEGMNKIRIDVYGHDGNKTPNSYKLSITRLPQPVLDITGVE